MTELTEFHGTEHHNPNSLVSIGGKLPYKLEIRTTDLLTLLENLYPHNFKKVGKGARNKINKWFYYRSRPGFYFEFSAGLHLAYADQRDGHGTQHYWRLFFDDALKERIENISKQVAIVVATGEEKKTEPKDYYQGLKEYYGMYFRSDAEIAIAEALVDAKVLFFANARGYVSGERSPVSASKITGRLELDFLVFKNGKCICLEVDGSQHNTKGKIERDYVRDRLILKEGIPTVRFTAKECFNQPKRVVEEFLGLF